MPPTQHSMSGGHAPRSAIRPRRSLPPAGWAFAIGFMITAGAAWPPTAVADPASIPVGGREPAGAAPEGVIDLADGGFLAGTLVPCPEVEAGGRRTLVWRSPHFAEPFEFRLDEIAGVRCAPPPAAPGGGRFLFHLRGGDTFSGDLAAVDADAITVAVGGGERPRTVRIERGVVESMCRRGAGGGSFVGPGGLAGWRQAPADSWREEAGRILSRVRGASVSRDVAVPPRARYDVVLSWKNQPEFRLAVGAADGSGEDGSWLEMIRGERGAVSLMLVRREGRMAEIAPVPVAVAGDWIRVVLFVDRERGRLAALFPDDPAAGGPADITLPPAGREQPPARLRLTLTSGDLCLESLRITAWSTPEPSLDETSGTVITRQSQRLADVVIEGFDAAADELVVRQGGKPVRLAAAGIDEIAFPSVGRPADAAAPVGGEPSVRVICGAGDMLSGDLAKIDGEGLWLRRLGIDVPVCVPYAEILAVTSLRAAASARELPGRIGWLRGNGFEMRGCLVGATVAEGAVAWQPLGSESASRFAGGPGGEPFGASLDYVESRPPVDEVELGGIGGMVNRNAEGQFIVVMLVEEGAAARDGRLQSGDQILAIAPAERSRFVDTGGLDAETVTNLLRGKVGTPVRLKVAGRDGGPPLEIDLRRGPISIGGGNLLRQALDTHARLAAERPPAAADAVAFPAVVILRNGDVADCRIEAIDEAGIRLRTPLAADPTAAVLVPGRFVKAIELVPAAASRTLDRPRVDRLLTVPRMQRTRPPTHLLRMIDGDYLRGRLVSLDADTVRFELLERVKDLPRGDVARIIWLHPEGPDAIEAEQGDVAAASSGAIPVEAVWSNGRKIGFTADTLSATTLRGRSRPLGPIGVAVDAVDRLRLGTAVGQDGGERPYARWVLVPAPEPRTGAETPPDDGRRNGQPGE